MERKKLSTHDAVGEKLETLCQLLITKIKEVAPNMGVHFISREAEEKLKYSSIVHLSGHAEELDKVQWSVIEAYLKENGCDSLFAMQGIYDAGQGVWAGFDLTGQPDEEVKAIERGETEPPYKWRYLEITVWVSSGEPAPCVFFE